MSYIKLKNKYVDWKHAEAVKQYVSNTPTVCLISNNINNMVATYGKEMVLATLQMFLQAEVKK